MNNIKTSATLWRGRRAKVCICAVITLFSALASASSPDPVVSHWAMNCNIRNAGDDDAALNVYGGGASPNQQVVMYNSSGDSATNQQWNVIPAQQNSTLWYLSPVSSPVGPGMQCLTFQAQTGSVAVLDYCSKALASQQFRIGLVQQGMRYIYHLINYATYISGPSLGVIPNALSDSTGNFVTLGPLSSSDFSGVLDASGEPAAEQWSFQNCTDSDGNNITFGAAWTTNGYSVGY